MKKNDVIRFFDERAEGWDEYSQRNENAIKSILDKGAVTKDKTVLDVACGTGILFPDYIKREVSSVTGIDIAPKMCEIARKKFCAGNIEIICGDAENYNFSRKFDCIMIHNAFPHFSQPEKLIGHLSEYLETGGRLCIAHSMSRNKINECHSGSAAAISVNLMHEEELSAMMRNWLYVDTVAADDEKYIVSGIKL